MKSQESGRNGLAWVTGGRVCVKNPGPGGRPASLLPSKDIELFVSGRRITTEELVMESSTVQVHLPKREPSVSYLIEITKDGLEAEARLEIREGLTCVLKDASPTERLELRYTAESVRPPADPKELLEAIRERGIELGIDTASCLACCEKPGTRPVVVARGVSPVPGKDGEIQFLVPMNRVVDLPSDASRIDFRDTIRLPDVKEGQTIAVKRPPEQGTAGVAVTGVSIAPPRPKDPKLRAGKGTELREEKGFVLCLASISGCPAFAEDSGTVSVEPVLTHKGDVDMTSGNVRSSGSVSIMGQVTEGMLVEAEGNQDIAGAVTEGTLRAKGSIRIMGNVFKSTVIAGKDSSWVANIDALLKRAEKAIASVLDFEFMYKEAASRLAAGVPELGDREILNENPQIDDFRDLVVAVSALLKEDLNVFPSWIADKVRATREALTRQEADVFDRTREVEALLSDVRAHVSEESLKGKSDVVLPYAQSCAIEASRDITVTGQGAFYCHLVAGRSIKVTGSPGLVRSGEAQARDLIQVNAAGGQGAAPTALIVGLGGEIQANTIYPNTVITVGRFSFYAEDTLQSVKAGIESGRLRVTASSGSWYVE